MSLRRTASGFLLLLSLAALGLLLVWLPPRVVDLVERGRQLGGVWGWIYLALVAAGGLLMGGSSLWILFTLWRRTRRRRQRQEQWGSKPSQLTREQQQREIDENLAATRDLQQELFASEELRRQLAPLVEQLAAKRASEKLEIVAFGTVSSGKSSLLNALAGRDVFQMDPRGGTTMQRNEIPWPGLEGAVLVDTPGLGEIEGEERTQIAAAAARDADLVLLVVDGPLRESEFSLLQLLGEMEKRILICLNKQDWYSLQDQVALCGQIASQAHGLVAPEDIIAVRSRPAQRVRVRVLADGRQVEERVSEEPDISALADRMIAIMRRDGRDLLMANLLLQSRGLVTEARERVRESLDRRAWEVVEKYTWGAGGAAALSPLPLIDLAAGGAITTKMVVELAHVYRQELDLQAAVTLLGQLGKNLLAILGVSAATPAVAAAVASLLKTVPGAGTLAGGLLQGLVQAVITRWIGGVFIQYYKNEMGQFEEGLATVARREWERVTSLGELRRMLQEARTRWRDPRHQTQTDNS